MDESAHAISSDWFKIETLLVEVDEGAWWYGGPHNQRSTLATTLSKNDADPCNCKISAKEKMIANQPHEEELAPTLRFMVVGASPHTA